MVSSLTGDRVILTPATIDDVSALMPAYNGDEQFNRWSGGNPVMSPEAVRADMLETLSIPGGVVWKITDLQHQLLGVAHTALVPPPHTAWIALLVIIRDRQHQGYGADAAHLLETYLFAQPDITDIGLAVLAVNQPAFLFWQQRGFVAGLRRRDQHGNEAITMRKNAPPVNP